MWGNLKQIKAHKEQIKDLYRRGYPPTAIAVRLGVPPDCIYPFLLDSGLMSPLGRHYRGPAYEFRGKRHDNGEWIYGYYFQNDGGYPYILSPYLRNPVSVKDRTVGQFTGWMDASDTHRKVYDGDIVEESFISPLSGKRIAYRWLVKFENGSFWLRGIGIRNDTIFFKEDMKVIGNRWDNPELLDVEK